jgi:FKBP-type peptidyl-prolyl cis-trans isomerase FklB
MTSNRCKILLAVALSLGVLLPGCRQEEQQRALPTQNEKLSYAIGLDIGRDVAGQELELHSTAVLRGIEDGLAGSAPALGDEELKTLRESFVEQRKTVLAKERQQAATDNRQRGEAFLAENTQKAGVITLPSGLQYRIITPGNGAQPTAEDNVKVHYRGYFIDGTEFENSYAQDQPAVFPVTRVIPGWTEALQLMKEGAKWELFVPAELAYGEKGAGKVIGPNQTLIFEIELLGIH